MAKKGKSINQLLGEKVRIIYTHYCHEDKQRLLELFTNQEQLAKNYKYTHSRRRVINRYIKGSNIQENDFRKQYKHFPFSQLKMHGKVLFSLNEFIQCDLDSFCEKLDAFSLYEQKATLDFDTSYLYLYMFDDKVNCYEIDYSSSKEVTCAENSWTVKIIPPKDKIGSEEYEGIISFSQSKISLNLFNSYDQVMMLFETSLKRRSDKPLYNNILYGLAIGISDHDQKIPVAKKVILTEVQMSQEQMQKHYLILNESEQLHASENLYTFEERELDVSYLSNYKSKIDSLHRFFSNVKYSPYIKTSLAQHMVFTEFHAFKKMYDKFSQNQDYFLSDRKRVYLEFLRFLKNYSEKEACIVLPIYKKSENIFLYESMGKQSIKELIISLAKEGVKFTIIFVIQSNQNLEHNNFYSILHQLHEVGIDLSFIYQQQIISNGFSEDFFYAQSHQYVISKESIYQNKNFTIAQNKQRIRGYIASFQKIYKQSFSYSDLQTQSYPYSLEHPLLEKLVGTWYCYFYGSFETKSQQTILWEGQIEIDCTFKVTEIIENRDKIFGKLTINERQSVITLLNQNTKNNAYIHINNRTIKKITPITLYAKQYQKDEDMISIGIMSVEKLDKQRAKTILGDPRNLILKAEQSLQNRIDDDILKNLQFN